MTSPELDPNRETRVVEQQVNGPPSVRELDINQDGKVDRILYDLDGDGQIERTEVDENFDGHIDTIYQWTTHPGEHTAVFHDYDHDGKFDNVWMDTNSDGAIDEIREDRNEDGNPEKVSKDSDFNGSFDQVRYDDNSDGQVDRIGNDTDGDGNPDHVLPTIGSTTVHLTGGGHVGTGVGISGDFAFGAGVTQSMGSAIPAETMGNAGENETMGTAEAQTLGDAPDTAGSFGLAPAESHLIAHLAFAEEVAAEPDSDPPEHHLPVADHFDPTHGTAQAHGIPTDD